MVVGLQLPVQLHPKVVRSNPADGELYPIQHLRDKVCQWLDTGQWFSPVSSTNKTNCHDITEILLIAALKTHKRPKPWLILQSIDAFESL